MTAYDVVRYPSGAFWWTHPAHLAAIARLHGLDAPPVETARVLDIGGGDGMNVLAMAEGLPRARFHSFDLAAEPVARGRAIAQAAGIGNVCIEVGDLLDPPPGLDGGFDYVVAHGVYAWTPKPVREAMMALIGRVLAADGVAYVSYNALPGGHHRRILREMMLHALGDVPDPPALALAAQRLLLTFAESRESEEPAVVALRALAARIASRSPEGLLHDELGDCFEPQAFADVVASAGAHGLQFLNDAECAALGDGLPETPVDEARLAHDIQARDHRTMAGFHRTLFVRQGRSPRRSPAPEAVRDLLLSTDCRRTGPDRFQTETDSIVIEDARLIDAVEGAAQAWPRRVRVGDLVDDDLRLKAVYNLFKTNIVRLHAAPFPGAAAAGERPCASRLARTLVEQGEETVFTLDLRAVALDDADVRRLLPLLDGRRDRSQIAAAWTQAGASEGAALDPLLARLAWFGLMAA